MQIGMPGLQVADNFESVKDAFQGYGVSDHQKIDVCQPRYIPLDAGIADVDWVGQMDGPGATPPMQLFDNFPRDGRDRIRRADSLRREQRLVEKIVQRADRSTPDLLVGVERQNLSRAAVSEDAPSRIVTMNHVRPLALDEAP